MCSCTVRYRIAGASAQPAVTIFRMCQHVTPKRRYIFTNIHDVSSRFSPLLSHNIKLYKLKVSDECFRMSECLWIKLARNLNTAQEVWSRAEGEDGMSETVTAVIQIYSPWVETVVNLNYIQRTSPTAQ